MGKSHAAKPLPFWASGNDHNKEKRFAQLGDSLLFHPAVKGLSANAFRVYVCCIMEAGGRKMFQFPESKALSLGFSRSTFRRSMAELHRKGFLSTVRSGKTTRTASDYEFSAEWKRPP